MIDPIRQPAVTRQEYLDYETVRSGGHVNMFTDARGIAEIMGISVQRYRFIQAHYAAARAQYQAIPEVP